MYIWAVENLCLMLSWEWKVFISYLESFARGIFFHLHFSGSNMRPWVLFVILFPQVPAHSFLHIHLLAYTSMGSEIFASCFELCSNTLLCSVGQSVPASVIMNFCLLICVWHSLLRPCIHIFYLTLIMMAVHFLAVLVSFCQLDTNWSHPKEGASTGKSPLSDWPVGRYVCGEFSWPMAEVEGSSPLRMVPLLGGCPWVIKKKKKK